MWGRSVILAALIALVPSSAGAQQAPQAQTQVPAKTWRQKEHGKLFRYRTGKNLPRLAAAADADVIVEAGVYPGLWGLGRGSTRPYPHPFLVDIANRADAVVIGVMTNSCAALTEEEDFIFTDWEMTVEEVIKNNVLTPIAIGATLAVTQPGGTMSLNGRQVHAREIAFDPFVGNRRYLLFLQYIPTTGAYRAFNDQSFELSAGSARGISRIGSWLTEDKMRDRVKFIEEVRMAVLTKP